ncbi:MAG: Ldh family oxidoreductase [Sphaerochaetaceae bacterium]|nr:Ldh family oxidoreductase [Sphaerochaetaceae bacterium]
MDKVLVDRNELTDFIKSVFLALGTSPSDSEDCARILVAADARGIPSHGVARLWRYKNGIQKGLMLIDAVPRTLRETPMSLIIDAQGDLGMGLSRRTMDTVIDKASKVGAAFASIRDSNHFGIAGFYSEMAARKDMIGIAMTNTAALCVPTFGSEAMLGTNPIAFSVPASDGRMFTLDMATTTVTRGKIEVYEREGKSLPPGWAVNTKGQGTSDAARLLEDMLYARGGGLLPLGGEGESLGGHKGYGLAALVDIMTALTSGGVFGKSVMDSKETSARVCHFFGAIRLDLFRDPEDFKADMSRFLDELENGRKAEGQKRIYYAGLKEHESEARSWKTGVELSAKVAQALNDIGNELGVKLPSMQ